MILTMMGRFLFRGHLLIVGLTTCLILANSNAYSNTPIITCSSSIELQRAIAEFCKPNDVVLELGAQLSDTSLEVCRTIGPQGKALLVDVERSEAKSGRCTHQQTKASFPTEGVATIQTLATLDDWKESLVHEYDIIIVDLGHMIGNDLYLTTLSLTNEILSVAQPRCMLVKSKSLSSLARRLIPSQKLLDGSFQLPTITTNEMMQMSPNNLKKEPYIFPAVGVNEYRRTIPFTVRPGDAVLEVGCHFGRTTTLLHQATATTAGQEGTCIGVDIGPKIIQSAREQYPEVDFFVADAWKTLQLLKLRSDGGLGYDVVYADIGGLSGAHGLLESLSLIDSLANSLEPRFIVIKSLCMRRLACQLRPFQEIWAKKQSPGAEADFIEPITSLSQ
jgi:tRNA A58 N-methylase Trm61